MRLRLATFVAFAQDALPAPPARVLEVGCGSGAVALALDGAGYDMTAIDPRAPEGPIFRQVGLEDFSDDEGFDAVVASVSLHHLERLDDAIDRIAGLLRPGGVLVVEEFAKERLVGPTARWYHRQRQSFVEVGLNDKPVPEDFDAWLAEWHESHADVSPLADVRGAIDRRFTERHAVWGSYLYDHWLHDAVEPLERALIEDGAIEATGFRYVGELRSDVG
jgi:ubiquinone/menaquinone biosynthesis C-methylase UbiE